MTPSEPTASLGPRPVAHPISLAAGTVLDCSPAERVSVAAAAGFEHAGIWVELADWAPATTAAVRERLDATGITALDVEVIRLRPDRPIDDARRVLDIAAALGAPNALVVSQDQDRTRTIDQYRELCEHGAAVGVRPALEFMRFMAVATLADAVEVVTAADHPAAAILVDALHLHRCQLTPDDVARLDPHLLAYAQLCDGTAAIPPPELLVDDALHRRLLPGDGALPLIEFVRVFGPEVPFSIEIRSAPLVADHPDPTARARAVAAASRRLLRAS